MKKKRILPMCLCLVLALGLSACNDLEDLLPSNGDDEMGDTSDTETGDTGDTEPGGSEGPSESVPTYSIKITDPSGDISLEVGDSKDIEVLLVTTVDNTDSGVAGTASEVTLSSSDSSVVSIEGLTITALAAGETVITATWTEHGVTSSGLAVTVTEPAVTPNPDVITYKVEITSPVTGSEIEINTETVVSVNLITITNGEEGEPVAATSSDVTITESGSSILSITDLTIKGLLEGEATIIATWNDHKEATDSITITIKNSNPSSGGEDVTSYGVSITSPTSTTVLKVGETLNVEASLITYTNGSETSTAAATYSDVTLTQSGNGSVTISNDSLTITGATAGDVTLTVTWTDHVGVTGTTASASVSFAVESVYTYKAVITAPTSGTSIEVDETTDVVVLLYTTIDGVEQSPVTASASDISLTQTGAGAVSFEGLTVKGVTAGEVTITATWTEQNVSDSVAITVTEPQAVFESYTITIQLKTSDGNAFPAPTGTYSVFINSEYDMTSGGEDESYWESWTTHIMTYDASSDTYSYTYTLLPTTTETTHTAKFYASPSESESDIYWDNGYLGEYEIPVTQDSVGTLSSGVQEITTSFTSWDDIFNPVASDVTFTYIITFKHNGATLEAADETISLSAHGNFNGTWDEDNSWWDWGEGVTLENKGDGTYNMVLDFVPENGRYFEIYVDDTTDQNQNDYDYVLGSYTISGLDQSATGVIEVPIDIEADYASFDELLHPSGQTYETMDINIVTIDTGNAGGNLYITGGIGGEGSSDYYAHHYTMESIANTDFANYGEAGNYYTFESWDKTNELEFCIHGASGDSYWTSCIQPTSDINTSSNSYQFWSSWQGKNSEGYWQASYFGISVPWIDNVDTISELTLVLSFDYSGVSTSDCVQLSMTYEFHVSH